ncbi:MAG: hypothetical protein K2W94_03950 [Alphaproteobacteria bacterium]|nr:hypothetical protein [Alphaproteobacteria bacterium]
MKKKLPQLYLIFGFLMHLTQVLAMEETDISVVVGCDGSPGQLQRYFQEIMGNGNCTIHDHMLHVDLRPTGTAKCACEKYQLADAKSWNPGGVVLQDVYMELFPSRGVRNEADLRRWVYQNDPREFERDFEEVQEKLPAEYAILKQILGSQAPSLKEMIETAKKEMLQPPETDRTLMPDTVKNLVRYMKEGATLAIEHIPYVDIRPLSVSQLMAMQFAERNPFHLYVSPLFMDLLQVCLAGDEISKEAVWIGVRERLQQQGIVETQIADLLAEANANETLCRRAILNIQALLPEEPFMEILQAELFALSEGFPNQKGPFVSSLSSVIAVELYMLQNQEAPALGIQKFLKDNGFRDVRMERVAENPYNQRKNSWMIFAKKNG